jgi:hypothetical protein
MVRREFGLTWVGAHRPRKRCSTFVYSRWDMFFVMLEIWNDGVQTVSFMEDPGRSSRARAPWRALLRKTFGCFCLICFGASCNVNFR